MVGGQKRLLIVAYTFPPYGTVGHVIRLVKFTRYLPDNGWIPTVLTVSDDARLRFFERNSHFLLSEVPPGIEIVRTSAWQPSPRWAKIRRSEDRQQDVAPPWRVHRAVIQFIRRQMLVPDVALPWIPVAVRAAHRLAKTRQFDAVLASIPLNSNGVIGAFIARALHLPLIVDVRDDWVGGAYYREKGPIARVVETRLERFVLGTATRIVVVSPLSVEQHHRRFPEWRGRFAYIPNGFDPTDLPVQNSDPIHDHSSRLLLVHSGMTGALRSPVPLFRALRSVVAAHSSSPQPPIQAIFVGELLPEYRGAIRELGLSEVVLTRPYLPRDAYLALLQEADVLIAIADRDYPTEIPGKLYTHWAVQRPTLLLAREGAASRLLADHQLGWTVDPMDERHIASTLTQLHQLKKAGQIPHVSRIGLERFDRRRLTADLAELLNELVSRLSRS